MKGPRGREIDPDEIFIDSSNLPAFDTDQFEGRFERPIGTRSFLILSGAFGALFAGLIFQAFMLQVVAGEEHAKRSEENRLARSVIFAERGTLEDRNGVPLAFNEGGRGEFPARVYTNAGGLAHVLGYAKPPQKDSSGIYYQERYIGIDGAERAYDALLSGENGSKIIEEDALGAVVSENIVRPPRHGETVTLSVDSRLSAALFDAMRSRVLASGFSGGAGVILDARTGEVLSLVSYPEYKPQALAEGSDVALVRGYFNAPDTPLLMRAARGLYTPGSIVKPYLAAGALAENIIDPAREILSEGFISIPNPYNPSLETRFNDWKAHGFVSMREAIAVSSNVYFFEIGGGYKNQRGLGIAGIEQYLRLFGFGTTTNFILGDVPGVLPNPAWKEKHFPDDPWRIGDTYNTAIGQYGLQVTPLQAARAAGALATGVLVEPVLRAGEEGKKNPVGIAPEHLSVVREGMRLGVVEGTASSLNLPFVRVAAKTGTAELGVSKRRVNSWSTGFFPYETGRYAFAVVLEGGRRDNLVGASAVMRAVFEWMEENAPEYFGSVQ